MSNPWVFRLSALTGFLLFGGCSFVGIRTSEEPPHTVIAEEGPYELRSYEESVVATTRIEVEDYDDSGSMAFRRLGGYIFGNNRKRGSEESESIAMTAPVIQEKSGSAWVSTFVMPAEHTEDSLPEPLDPNVELRTVPGRRVASIRYSGSVDEDKIREHAAKLSRWVEAQGLVAVSSPRSARYDPPWTLPFLRRNEVHIDVK